MPSTIPILSLASPATRSELELSDVEKIDGTQAPQHESQRSPGQSSWAQVDFSRIPRLLLIGYPTKAAQRRYERQQDWVRLHAVLRFKVEKVVLVSGLLLGADTNLLVSGDLRRMTYTAVSASLCLSLLSIIFGCLCLWILVHPTRLKVLVRHATLFYYLCGTPSLFGGASALAFFVAVASWTWLDDAAAEHGWGGKICSIILGSVLVINAGVCFFLGASTEDIPEVHEA